MSQPHTQRLPRVQGVAAFRKGEIYAMPVTAAAVSHRGFDSRPNTYTTADSLGRLYTPSPPPARHLDGAASTSGPAGHGRRTHGALTALQAPHPHHLAPLARVSPPVPAGYAVDAARFAHAVEESQRTAIKFEEYRTWQRLVKSSVAERRRAESAARQPRPVAWHAASPPDAKVVRPSPVEVLVAYDAASSATESDAEDGSRAPPSHASLRALRAGHASSVVDGLVDAHFTSLQARPSVPPLVATEEEPPRLHATESLLPTLRAKSAALPRRFASEVVVQQSPGQREAQEEGATDSVSPAVPPPKPASALAPRLTAAEEEMPVLRADAHEDAWTPQRALPSLPVLRAAHVEAPQPNHNTLREERRCEAASWVGEAVQHATTTMTATPAPSPQRVSLPLPVLHAEHVEAPQPSCDTLREERQREAASWVEEAIKHATTTTATPAPSPQRARTPEVLLPQSAADDLNDVQLLQLAACEEQPAHQRRSHTAVQSEEGHPTPPSGAAELLARRRAEAAALVAASLFSSVPPLPRLTSTEEEAAVLVPGPPAAAAPPEETAESPLIIVSPPRDASSAVSADVDVLRQLRRGISRSLVDSILSRTGTVPKLSLPVDTMYTIFEGEQAHMTVTVAPPPLPLSTSIKDHRAGASSPPMPPAAAEADLHALRTELARSLVMAAAASTSATEPAPPTVGGDCNATADEARLSEMRYHAAGVFVRAVV